MFTDISTPHTTTIEFCDFISTLSELTTAALIITAISTPHTTTIEFCDFISTLSELTTVALIITAISTPHTTTIEFRDFISTSELTAAAIELPAHTSPFCLSVYAVKYSNINEIVMKQTSLVGN